MLDKIEKSCIHIAVVSKGEVISDSDKEFINSVLFDTFGVYQEMISEATSDQHVEIIYEVKTPVMKNDDILDKFYKDLRFVFSELSDYNPHFTQFKKEEIY